MHVCRTAAWLDDFLEEPFRQFAGPTRQVTGLVTYGTTSTVIYATVRSLVAVEALPVGPFRNRWPAVASSRGRCVPALREHAVAPPRPAPRPRLLTLGAPPALPPTFSLRGSRRQRYRRPSRRRSRS